MEINPSVSTNRRVKEPVTNYENVSTESIKEVFKEKFKDILDIVFVEDITDESEKRILKESKNYERILVTGMYNMRQVMESGRVGVNIGEYLSRNMLEELAVNLTAKLKENLSKQDVSFDKSYDVTYPVVSKIMHILNQIHLHNIASTGEKKDNNCCFICSPRLFTAIYDSQMFIQDAYNENQANHIHRVGSILDNNPVFVDPYMDSSNEIYCSTSNKLGKIYVDKVVLVIDADDNTKTVKNTIELIYSF